MRMGSPKKVVVVGAGIAGLTIAYRLMQNGIDVALYEAKKRVGGRILSAKIGDATAELGGQNISDGGSAENLHRLIDFFQLDVSRIRVGLDIYYYADGNFYAGQELLDNLQLDKEHLKIRLQKLARQCTNMQQVLDLLVGEDSHLNKMLSARLAGYEGAIPKKLSTIFIETLYHMLLGGIAAAHEGPHGEQGSIELESISGGNSLLPEKLSEQLGERLHLNMPLRAISKRERGYQLTFDNFEKPIVADILVLAIPCTVYEDLVFEGNPIPEERLRAIKNVLYGSNSKIIAPFATKEKRVSFINDHMGAFFNAECDLMTFYYTAASSYFSQKTLLETFATGLGMVEKGLKQTYALKTSPTYASDLPLIPYNGPVGYSWPTDPFIKGSYSTIGSGQEKLLLATESAEGEQVKSLFAPIDQSLYFVGEHTSILFNAPGTMEAACESGERMARLILSQN